MTLASPQTRCEPRYWTATELSARFPEAAPEIAAVAGAGVALVEVDGTLSWVTLAVPGPGAAFVAFGRQITAWVFLDGIRDVVASPRFAELAGEALR